MNPRILTLCVSLFCMMAASWTAAAASPEARQCPPETVAAGNGGEKVIYGTDDRIDVYQETNAARKALAASVCAIVSSDQLAARNGGGWRLATGAYTYQSLPACASEPFGSQPTAPFCTGFLVGPDIIATAGHCCDAGDYTTARFVFGFEMTNAGTAVIDFTADQVYSGVELLGHQLNDNSGLDYAVVRLDRAVTVPGAVPLPIRRTGSVALNTAVGVIGHPWGLPKKIAFGATTHVTQNTESGYFKANLDTYGGNSGSPVFNAATGMVEGILVRGNDDFEINGSCFVSNTMPDSTVDAEGVSRATTFAQFVPELVQEAELLFDRSAYTCTATVTLTLTDENAAGTTQQVTLTSGNGDTETLTLAETSAGSRQFTAAIPLQTTAVTAQDGALNIVDGASLNALYSDADNGQGTPENVTAAARIDCTPPVISSVSFSEINGASELASFHTNEPATGAVAFAASCGAAGAPTAATPSGTSHSVLLTGLAPSTAYFASITATDAAGNSTTNDNGGNCHTFTSAAIVVADGGFELGNPNSAWTQGSTNFGSVICSLATCGSASSAGTLEGAWWVWLGGVENVVEDGYVAQSVTIPAMSAPVLTFQLMIPAAHVPGQFRVTMDGTQLFQATQANAADYATFTAVTVPLSAYAGKGTHMLRFEGHTDGTGTAGVTNFYVDAVTVGPSRNVPGVVGQTQDAAASTLLSAGLTAQVGGRQCSDSVPAGQVISQSPPANGTAARGATVSLVISTGPCSTATLDEIAQDLYDSFSTADTDSDGYLSLTEAQAAVSGMSTASFNSLDADGNGSLSEDELASYLGIDPGCSCFGCNLKRTDFTPESLRKWLGDLFLGGLSIMALVLMAGRRHQ